MPGIVVVVNSSPSPPGRSGSSLPGATAPSPNYRDPNHTYGPSQIAETNAKPQNSGPWVPSEHPHHNEYFRMEQAVQEAEAELHLTGARVNSAYRDASSGEFPSKRHADGAIDINSTNPDLARLISKKLGPGYFVQIEHSNTPGPGYQLNEKYYDGQRVPFDRDRDILDCIWNACGSGNHIHIQRTF